MFEKILRKLILFYKPRKKELSKRYPGGFPNQLTKQEAYLILNIDQDTPKEEISKRHRKLLMLNHPDKGGSTYIALKINQAKEILINEGELKIDDL